MKQERNITARTAFGKSPRPAPPGGNLLCALMASFVAHGLVILLIAAAGGLFSVPADTGSLNRLNITLVSWANAPSSSSAHPGQEESAGAAAEAAGKGIPSVTAVSEDHSDDGRPLNAPPPEKPAKRLPRPASLPGKAQDSGAEKTISIPAGPDLQTPHAGTALSVSFPAAESGRDAASMSSGSGMERNVEPSGRFHAISGSTLSRYRQTPPPIYPASARRKGYEGLVLISVEILENGAPGQLLVKKSSGHVILDQAALEAIRKWKFVPAEKNGLPVRSRGDVPIRFVLRDAR